MGYQRPWKRVGSGFDPYYGVSYTLYESPDGRQWKAYDYERIRQVAEGDIPRRQAPTVQAASARLALLQSGRR